MLKNMTSKYDPSLGKPWLGCIADDYTGATDLASFLVASGLRTLQVNGLPVSSQLDELSNIDAIVIALKTRNEPVDEAVEQTLVALKTLENIGCEKYYIKYCSTFDSTDEGNIGPVIDACLDYLNQHSTLVCPALPVNGRTVYQGNLFVFDQLLHESPMKDHPLTPMTDCSLLRMIEAQGKGKTALIPYHVVDQGADAVHKACSELKDTSQYLVIDALNDSHLIAMHKAIDEFPLITGGSGLALALGQVFARRGGALSDAHSTVTPINAPTLILSGSCSAMTQKQVEAYKSTKPYLVIDVDKLVSKEQTVDTILSWLDTVKQDAPLVTATALPEDMRQNQKKYGTNVLSELIEQTFSDLAFRAHTELGFSNFIVAGGETSGAVVNGLGVTSFLIGKPIAPGVPMVQTKAVPTKMAQTKIKQVKQTESLNLALKSGNFGQSDFFFKAVETLSCY